VATSTTLFENPSVLPASGTCQENWYAVQTRARHERVVMQRFQDKGLTAFLPVITEKRRWSDRWKEVELPLFSCYVFVKIMATNEDRLRVLCTDSVFDFVGATRQGTPIPDEQIEAVQTIVNERINWETFPFLKIGQRVRIRSGSLTGVEGILVSRSGKRSVVVSVDAIQRSLAVRVEGYEIEAV
jgi:transcription antitermination factor NusG